MADRTASLRQSRYAAKTRARAKMWTAVCQQLGLDPDSEASVHAVSSRPPPSADASVHALDSQQKTYPHRQPTSADASPATPRSGTPRRGGTLSRRTPEQTPIGLDDPLLSEYVEVCVEVGIRGTGSMTVRKHWPQAVQYVSSLGVRRKLLLALPIVAKARGITRMAGDLLRAKTVKTRKGGQLTNMVEWLLGTVLHEEQTREQVKAEGLMDIARKHGLIELIAEEVHGPEERVAIRAESNSSHRLPVEEASLLPAARQVGFVTQGREAEAFDHDGDPEP